MFKILELSFKWSQIKHYTLGVGPVIPCNVWETSRKHGVFQMPRTPAFGVASGKSLYFAEARPLLVGPPSEF